MHDPARLRDTNRARACREGRVLPNVSKAFAPQRRAELDECGAAGEIEIFKGTLDTGGNDCIVNCPSPIVAPNDVEAT